MAVIRHQGRTFDATTRYDPRNEQFTLRRGSRENPALALHAKARRTRRWTLSAVLDQGNLGSCVGNGCAHFLKTTPYARPLLTESDAVRIYHEAQNRDQWPGANYEGTSLLAGMKALASDEKEISSYFWLDGTNEVALALGYLSPVVIAVTWRQDMMQTSWDGLIHASGARVGGHCVCVTGYNDATKRFTIAQSWGSNWGTNGFCEISELDLGVLLADGGQAVLPRKLKNSLTP